MTYSNSKKAMTASTILWIVLLVIGIFIGIGFLSKYLNPNKNINLLKELGKPYTSGDLSGNAYFTAESVGILYNRNKIENLNAQNSPCYVEGRSNDVTRVKCDFKGFTNNREIVFSVSVVNLGSASKNFFPNPLICYDSEIDDCEGDYAVLSSPCKADPSAPTECLTEGFIFDKDGDYNIYPGAKCLASDCNDPNAPEKDVYGYTRSNYIKLNLINVGVAGGTGAGGTGAGSTGAGSTGAGSTGAGSTDGDGASGGGGASGSW